MMRHFKSLILSALIAGLLAGAAQAADDAALAALISAAQENNPQIMAARERTAEAEQRVAQAGAKLGPKASAMAGALWQRDGLDPLKGQDIPLLGLNLKVGYRNTYAAAIGLSQVIYSGGSLQAQKKAAELNRDSCLAQENRTKQSVSNAVRRAYYALRSAQAKELVASDALSLTKRHLIQAEKLFAGGVVARNDVLRSKVAVSQAELDLIRAQNGRDLALTALRRAVGAEPAGRLEEDRPLDRILEERGDMAVSEKADVEAAFAARDELKVYALLAKQAEKLARAAQGQLLPQILGAVGWVAADDKFFPTEQNEPVAALGVYWNFYDGGEMRAKTNEAKAKAKELLFQLDDMKNAVRMEVTQAELNLRSAQSRLDVAARQLASSREDYRIAVRRYTEKVGTNLDTLDARLALTNSMSEVVTAIYDIKTAEADLICAMGR